MMARTGVTRRRAIGVLASAFAGAAMPGLGHAATARPVRWHGTALGAKASLTLYHPDPVTAQKLIGQALAEIRRLEKVFSLYRGDSALTALNRDGALTAPPLDLVRLLAKGQRFGVLTDGAFDMTVQPLWELYRDHFALPSSAISGPSDKAIAAVLAKVDYRAVEIASDRISFTNPGMAITLNGIAQGYITDRVADLLRAGGMRNVLVDLGEARAEGSHPDGRPWRLGIREDGKAGHSGETYPLRDRAVATSAPAGTPFEPTGRYHHLFDPRTGQSTNRYSGISVFARFATEADAFSTAFASMTEQDIVAVLNKVGDTEVVLHRKDGSTKHVAVEPA
jgi:FAD:protein FMN transferase